MEYFWGSVKLMLIVYALAAFISFMVAWIIKLIFAGIQMQKDRAAAPGKAPGKPPLEQDKSGPERKA